MKISVTESIFPWRGRRAPTDDELIDELDRRLADQGFEPKTAGVRTVIEYLQEGWSLVALPPELAEQYDGVIGSGHSIHHLAGELRRRLPGGPILPPEDASILLNMVRVWTSSLDAASPEIERAKRTLEGIVRSTTKEER